MRDQSTSAPIRVLVRIRPMTRQENTDGENTRPAVFALSVGSAQNIASTTSSSMNDVLNSISDTSSHLSKEGRGNVAVGGGIVRVISPAPAISGVTFNTSLLSSSSLPLTASQSSVQFFGIAGKGSEQPLHSTNLVTSLTSSSLTGSNQEQQHIPSVVHDQVFDRVFPPTSTQQEIFDELIDLVNGVAAGINATIFAYGQTGTGKTHTMMGSGVNSNSTLSADKNLWGIIPRATELLFKKLEEITTEGNKSNINPVIDGKRPPLSGEGATTSPIRITVNLSYMQIYNDKVYDLLTDSTKTSHGGTGTGTGTIGTVNGRGAGTIALFEKPLAIREGRPDKELVDPSHLLRATSGSMSGSTSVTRSSFHSIQKGGEDEAETNNPYQNITRRSLSACRGDPIETSINSKIHTQGSNYGQYTKKGGRSPSPLTVNGVNNQSNTNSSSFGSNTNVHVVGLSQHSVTSFSDVSALLQRGSAMRAVRSTEFNESSSRSHAVLQFSVEIQKEVPILNTKVAGLTDRDEAAGAIPKAGSSSGRVIAIRRAKLNLVDLAGSEKWFAGVTASSSSSSFNIDAMLNTTGSVDDFQNNSIISRPHSSSSSSSLSVAPNRLKRETRDRARELVSINKSLSALGNCIAALAEISESNSGVAGPRQVRTHVPYRDSALTRLLRDSLGGNTKTVIIATISPSALCLEETFSTLNFAGRARRVFCRVRVNEHATEALQLDRARREILRLRKELDAYKRLDALVVRASEGITGGTVAGIDQHGEFKGVNIGQSSTSVDEININDDINSIDPSASDMATAVTRRVAAALTGSNTSFTLSPVFEKGNNLQEIDAAAVQKSIASPTSSLNARSMSGLTENSLLNSPPSQYNATMDSDILELIYSLALSSPLISQQKDSHHQHQVAKEGDTDSSFVTIRSPLTAVSPHSRSRFGGLSPNRSESHSNLNASRKGSSNNVIGSSITGSIITGNINLNNNSSSKIVTSNKSPDAQQLLRGRRPSQAALHLAQSLGVSPSVLLSTGLIKSPYAQPVLNTSGGRHSLLLSRHALQKGLYEDLNSIPVVSERSSSHSASPRLLPSSRLSRSQHSYNGQTNSPGYSRGMESYIDETEIFQRRNISEKENDDAQSPTLSPFSSGSKKHSPASHRITISPPTSDSSLLSSKSKTFFGNNQPPASPIIIDLDTTIRGGFLQHSLDPNSSINSAAAKRRAFINKAFNENNYGKSASTQQLKNDQDNLRFRTLVDRTPVVGYTAEYPSFTSDGSGLIVQSSHPIIFFSPQESQSNIGGTKSHPMRQGSTATALDDSNQTSTLKHIADKDGFYSPSIYLSRNESSVQDGVQNTAFPARESTRQNSQVKEGSMVLSASKGRIHMASNDIIEDNNPTSQNMRSFTNVQREHQVVQPNSSPSPPLLPIFFAPSDEIVASSFVSELTAPDNKPTTALASAYSTSSLSKTKLSNVMPASPFEKSIAAGKKLDSVIHSSGPSTPVTSKFSENVDNGFESSKTFTSSGFSSSGFFYHNASPVPYASPKAALPSRKGSAASVTSGNASGLFSPASRRTSSEAFDIGTSIQSVNTTASKLGSGIMFSPTVHTQTNVSVQLLSPRQSQDEKSQKTVDDFVQEALDEEISREEAIRIASLRPPGPPKTPRPTPLHVPVVSRIEERNSESVQQSLESTRSFDQGRTIQAMHDSSRSSDTTARTITLDRIDSEIYSFPTKKSYTIEIDDDFPKMYSQQDAESALSLLRNSENEKRSDNTVIETTSSTEKISDSSASYSKNSRVTTQGSVVKSSEPIQEQIIHSQMISSIQTVPLSLNLSTTQKPVVNLSLHQDHAKDEIEVRQFGFLARKAESDDLAISIEAIRERALAHLSQADLLVASLRGTNTSPIQFTSSLSNIKSSSIAVHENVSATQIKNETDKIASFLSNRKLQSFPVLKISTPEDKKVSPHRLQGQEPDEFAVSLKNHQNEKSIITRLSLKDSMNYDSMSVPTSQFSSMEAPRRINAEHGNKIIWFDTQADSTKIHKSNF
jgi:hypothetical protein